MILSKNVPAIKYCYKHNAILMFAPHL